jgi:small subunit ribosomal protein S5
LLNVAMATFEALQQLRTPEEMAAMRGKPVEELLPFWERAVRRNTSNG